MALTFWFQMLIYFEVTLLCCQCVSIKHHQKLTDHLIYGIRSQSVRESIASSHSRLVEAQNLMKNKIKSETIKNAIRQRFPTYSSGLHGVWGLPG
jgi:hypothetical protein